MRCTGAATLMAAITWPLWSRMGAATQRRPTSISSSSMRVAARADGGELLPAAPRASVMVLLGVALEAVVDHLLHDLRRLEGEQRLADARAMRRRARAQARATCAPPGGSRGCGCRARERWSRIASCTVSPVASASAWICSCAPRGRVHLAAHQRAQLEERQAQAVFPGLAVLLEDVVFDERGGEAVHGALGEPQARGERADAHLGSCSEKALVSRIDVGHRGQAHAPRLGLLELVHGWSSLHARTALRIAKPLAAHRRPRPAIDRGARARAPHASTLRVQAGHEHGARPRARRWRAR